ncbi:unnamed protein product [Rhizopus stolonifer]
MTVIYTETHLTSDPVYGEDKASFTIALSNISIECHTHRDENLNYIRANKIRTGDLVSVDGVFMTETKTSGIYYIKVFTLALLSGESKKKRRRPGGSSREILTMIENRLQQRLRVPIPVNNLTSVRHNTGLYQEFTGGFSDYFFMLYGKIGFVTTGPEKREERERMLNIMSRIYSIFGDMSSQGLDDFKLNSFVNSVTELVQRINGTKQALDVQVPPGLVIDLSVPLPTVIYNNFVKD